MAQPATQSKPQVASPSQPVPTSHTAPKLPEKPKDGASGGSKVTNFVGKTVCGFEIQKLIGQGKFSFVFRAKRISDNVLVALKLIKVSRLSPLTLSADLRHGQREVAR